MAHFAEVDDDGNVLRVIVVNNDVVTNKHGVEDEELGVEFCKSLYGKNTLWKQTSYNGSKRRRYAGIGDKYHNEHDAFIHRNRSHHGCLIIKNYIGKLQRIKSQKIKINQCVGASQI
jgi:hypothetical protein